MQVTKKKIIPLQPKIPQAVSKREKNNANHFKYVDDMTLGTNKS